MSGRAGALPSPRARRMRGRRTTPMARTGPEAVSTTLGRELAGIRQLLVLMGEEVDRAVTRAICGLVDRDTAVCEGVVSRIDRLDGLERELHHVCRTTILERDPDARELREAMGLLQAAAELSRAGDDCAGIARIGRELAGAPEPAAEIPLTDMAELCCEQLREVLVAVGGRDLARLEQLAARDERLERLCHDYLRELTETVCADPGTVGRVARLIAVAGLLERITDRVAAIAEDLVLLDGGEPAAGRRGPGSAAGASDAALPGVPVTAPTACRGSPRC